MSTVDQIEARAKILEALSHGGYRAELANGHVCIARIKAGASMNLAPGEWVQLAFHPADLSRARIIGRE